MASGIEFYDTLLIVVLLGTAWSALFGREAFTSTVLFVVFGLLMAMAWIQLGATDVALAEACIGAGLTGALLIGAIRQFENGLRTPSPASAPEARVLRILMGTLSILVLIGMLTVVLALADRNESVWPVVQKNLDISGTEHPVTAVLLNFRAFDTWLELGVLLLASIGAITTHFLYDDSEIPSKVSSVQKQPPIVASGMLPILILVGGVLLWFGSRAPGGAFQAGSLIGAAGILLQIGGDRSFLRLSSLRVRFTLALGFLGFLVTAGITYLHGARILEYSPRLAGFTILMLEVGATVSIALTLNVMYACSHPWRRTRA